MAARWPIGMVMICALSSACHRTERSQSPSMCDDGQCDQTSHCTLGICGEDLGLTVAGKSSPREGTFAEGLDAACPYSDVEPSELEAMLDDSSIPECNVKRSRASNLKTGNSRLQDHELHQHLLGVQSALFECLDIAACFDAEQAGVGEFDFELEIEPDGRVSAVSVDPSDGLDHPIIRACARRSLFNFKFPSWNGATMLVSYRVAIAETTG